MKKLCFFSLVFAFKLAKLNRPMIKTGRFLKLLLGRLSFVLENLLFAQALVTFEGKAFFGNKTKYFPQNNWKLTWKKSFLGFWRASRSLILLSFNYHIVRFYFLFKGFQNFMEKKCQRRNGCFSFPFLVKKRFLQLKK